jgi:hypothetical protein
MRAGTRVRARRHIFVGPDLPWVRKGARGLTVDGAPTDQAIGLVEVLVEGRPL